MKTLTEAELKRIDANYEMLDALYASLREYSALQRKGFSSGNVLAQSVCDSIIALVSISVGRVWSDTQNLLAEPQPEQPITPPVKEVLQ